MVSNSATHYQYLLEGRNKEIAGSTYREIKGLVQSIIQNGYFDWKAQPEIEPELKEPEIVEPIQEAPTHVVLEVDIRFFIWFSIINHINPSRFTTTFLKNQPMLTWSTLNTYHLLYLSSHRWSHNPQPTSPSI